MDIGADISKANKAERILAGISFSQNTGQILK